MGVLLNHFGLVAVLVPEGERVQLLVLIVELVLRNVVVVDRKEEECADQNEVDIATNEGKVIQPSVLLARRSDHLIRQEEVPIFQHVRILSPQIFAKTIHSIGPIWFMLRFLFDVLKKRVTLCHRGNELNQPGIFQLNVTQGETDTPVIDIVFRNVRGVKQTCRFFRENLFTVRSQCRRLSNDVNAHNIAIEILNYLIPRFALNMLFPSLSALFSRFQIVIAEM